MNGVQDGNGPLAFAATLQGIPPEAVGLAIVGASVLLLQRCKCEGACRVFFYNLSV
jgi:hypothetical protein